MEKKPKIMKRSKFIEMHGGEDKAPDYDRVEKPFYKRSWFRNTVRAVVVLGTGALAYGINEVEKFADRRDAAKSNRSQELSRFLNSKEFQAYADVVAEKAFWALKYVGDNPQEAQSVIPAREDSAFPWTVYAHKLQEGNQPKNTIVNASNSLSRGLAKQGFDFKAEERLSGFNKMLELLPPYLNMYGRHDTTSFAYYIRYEPNLQHDIVQALARNRGDSVTGNEIERLGVFCRYFGDKGMEYAGKLAQEKQRIGFPRNELAPITALQYNLKNN